MRLGPPVLQPDDGDAFVCATVADFERSYGPDRSKVPHLVIAHDLPAAAAAWVGINLFARGENVSWMVDGDAQRGYSLVYDENANGDLRDDPRHAFSPIDGGFELAIPQLLPTKDRALYPWEVRLRVRGGRLFLQDERVRRGTVELDGRARAIELRSRGGFAEPQAVVAIDLDGDGMPGVPMTETPHTRWLRELDSPEVVRLTDPAINIGARTYDLAVDATGDQLTLTPRATRMPDRVSLRPGSIAPDFTVEGLDGQRVQLSALRGHPVLIDFWQTHCGPCIAALPRLAELARRHRDLELVSLAGDESADDVRATLDQYPHAGRVALSSAALASQYRVYAWPTFFIVGADGTLALSRGSLAEVLAYFDRPGDKGAHDRSTR